MPIYSALLFLQYGVRLTRAEVRARPPLLSGSIDCRPQTAMNKWPPLPLIAAVIINSSYDEAFALSTNAGQPPQP